MASLAFKVDENLPREVAAMLREAGHDAATVLDQHLGGGTDEALIDLCAREGRALVTLDLDFANIRHYPPEDYAGIIVLHPPSQDISAILSLVESLLPSLPLHPLPGHLWSVSEAAIRLRPGEQRDFLKPEPLLLTLRNLLLKAYHAQQTAAG